ncbi:hypothetical protein GOV07_01945 [Candidatus Woesearchaeota archaeon]|nr:hypothetical protein [Candidatus Woesearchaeota archaeon]
MLINGIHRLPRRELSVVLSDLILHLADIQDDARRLDWVNQILFGEDIQPVDAFAYLYSDGRGYDFGAQFGQRPTFGLIGTSEEKVAANLAQMTYAFLDAPRSKANIFITRNRDYELAFKTISAEKIPLHLMR